MRELKLNPTSQPSATPNLLITRPPTRAEPPRWALGNGASSQLCGFFRWALDWSNTYIVLFSWKRYPKFSIPSRPLENHILNPHQAEMFCLLSSRARARQGTVEFSNWRLALSLKCVSTCLTMKRIEKCFIRLFQIGRYSSLSCCGMWCVYSSIAHTFQLF